ncbi:TP53-binding protein 1 isoform X1 [Xyrichtys novacula]|uniref:TP53-binding protein 1 n=1 Tax=Xyrichtys novacula TaxID=13765 RepID=A0AAV1EMU4_XYRNO|nr:TP53-binding protein 1 isoform X1 [Xyrichtys novacula]
MDPGAGELDSSLPQPENPCLIVEDSQPDSVALEDDPESSYRALLARRLSSLQPRARSPVLELIASPTGSRSSQTDSQSESSERNAQSEPGATAADPTPALHQDSQVLNICPPPVNSRCAAEDSEMDSGADSTTHCVQTEEGTSQFGFLELSQSQDLRGDMVNRQDEGSPQPDRPNTSEDQQNSGTAESQDLRATRSEVSSSSSLESQPGRKISVQVLLHSQGLQDQQDDQILSSQQDLFDGDKSGGAVDSTVSEPEQQGGPTPTPAQTLSLLHLSGQGTLVQESLSQSSVDYVAPTQDLSHTPLIIPSSPTDPEDEHAVDELMDTAAPPEGRAGKKEEPMDTDTASKPHPSASTPVSQNPPGFALERTLSVPSQPEFSHDVFVPTQSQETPQHSEKRRTPSQSQRGDSVPVCLQLSVNSQSARSDQLTSDQPGEDSQATQIEDLTEPAVDVCDSVTSRGELSKVSSQSQSQTASRSQTKLSAESQNHQSERTDRSDRHRNDEDALKVKNTTVTHRHADRGKVNSQSDSSERNSCVQDTPTGPAPLTPPKSEQVMKTAAHLRGGGGGGGDSDESADREEEEEDREEEEDSVIIVTESNRNFQSRRSKISSSQPIRGNVNVSSNGHQNKRLPSDRLSQPERAGPEAEGLKEKSLSDSSGEISFHFTLPKEGELIGPAVGATPPLIAQLKQTLRHSTPIEISSFSEKSADVSADVAMAASDIVSGESREDSGERGEGKLSLRMKLVTPVEEGSSGCFSLQKPVLSEGEGPVLKVSSAHQVLNSSPSVFSRVRQVHRQQDTADDQDAEDSTPVRGELFASPQRSSQASLGCNSISNSQSEQQVFTAPQQTSKDPTGPAEPSKVRPGPPEAPQTPSRARVPSQISENNISPSQNKTPRQKATSQQTSLDSAGLRSPSGRGEPGSPPFRRNTGPAHRRHVRTIQEVRTTVTRIITDVYYEDGKEVDRKVSQEREEPVVDCQVLDGDISPCRTGSSSVTSGDLADVSSLSSKASSLQHSSGGTSSSGGFIRSEFILPPSRGGKSTSPRRGGGQHQRGPRGHRGQRAGSTLTANHGHASLGPRALTPFTHRGRAKRGRPPSRSSLSRGGGVSSAYSLSAHAQTLSSSEDEPYAGIPPARLPVSPSEPSPSSRSDSLRSSPEEASSAGSSFVGLRVVAKWSSNGYFYSGRIIKDTGDAKFRLRFDDGYECEVAGKDILLCDPIPVETEVTALLEDQYFSTGVVKGHKTEGEELLYSVEKDGQRQWYSRTSIILSLDQGNKLREQHSLGPYEPSTPLTKASDISLDNLVEGKRRRRGAVGGENSPQRGSSSSPRTPRTPGPSSGKRKLQSSEDGRTPSKRGRRGGGARAAQRTGVCNTSGSGTDLPGRSSDDVTETHGPLPQNASLFLGFAFMLTASSENDRLTNRQTSEDEEDIVQTGPYNKAYTESQLQAGGGFILPDFNEEQCKAAYQSLLIADQHCRTRKYLLCVASGVPCVSHIWVRDCCKENKLLNYRNYLLPAGAEPGGAIVEWHPRCSPFKSLRVLVALEQSEELWTQLISLGGGATVGHSQSNDGADVPSGKFDVVLTDHTCPPSIQKQMTSQEVPLVSAEWIIQSIIRGEKQGYHSNPEYRHDYSSS